MSDGMYVDERTGMVVKDGHRYYDVGYQDGSGGEPEGNDPTETDSEFFSESFLRDRGIHLKSFRRRTDGTFGVLNRHMGHAIGDRQQDREREKMEQQWRLQHYVGDFSGGMPREAVQTHYSEATGTQYSLPGPRTASSVYLLSGQGSTSRARYGEEDAGGGVLAMAGAEAATIGRGYAEPDVQMPSFKGGGSGVGDMMRDKKKNSSAQSSGGSKNTSHRQSGPGPLHLMPLGYKMALMEQRFEALEYGVSQSQAPSKFYLLLPGVFVLLCMFVCLTESNSRLSAPLSSGLRCCGGGGSCCGSCMLLFTARLQTQQEKAIRGELRHTILYHSVL